MSSSNPGGQAEPPLARPPSNPHPTSGTLGAVVTAVVIAALFIGFLIPLPSYNADARTLPLVVGIPAAILAAANVVRQYLRFRRERRREGVANPDLRARLRRLVTPREGDSASVAVAVGWVVAATTCVLVLGFLWGSIVFMPAFMILYGRERMRSVALYAGGLLAVLYVVFIVGLNVPYFPGFFTN